jgi:hypothetical protein
VLGEPLGLALGVLSEPFEVADLDLLLCLGRSRGCHEQQREERGDERASCHPDHFLSTA